MEQSNTTDTVSNRMFLGYARAPAAAIKRTKPAHRINYLHLPQFRISSPGAGSLSFRHTAHTSPANDFASENRAAYSFRQNTS